MDFSLYIHVPYCDSKCPYCDFNSHAVRRWPEDRYVASLQCEMRAAALRPEWRDGVVQTVFFGGGTPSLFDPASIKTLLRTVGECWSIGAGAEITLEANPGTVDAAKLSGFRGAGVNRLSFGVQSFNDQFLATLGRIHDAASARQAVRDAMGAGFDNLNVDLMFAVPGQSVEEWEADLRSAIELGTAHVSAYNLTFEEGTAFFAMRRRGELRPLDEATEIAMYQATARILAAAGFERYEISNYARPGRPCRHNLTYWRLLAYLGVGAGAHSFSPPDQRWSNELGPEKYMADIENRGHARVREERLSGEQARGEFAFLGLRCCAGIRADEFLDRFGLALLDAFPQCSAMRDRGLLEEVGERWRLTERGLMVADEIFATFV